MKIGILSDTHKKENRSQKVIDHLMNNGAEFLVHAGDILKEQILEQMVHSGVPYVAVYGNNDAHLHEVHNRFNLVQEPHYFKLAGTRIKLMHLPFYMSPDAEIVIYGHTHTFDCEFTNGTLFLNPGEACARNKPVSECAMLELTETHMVVTYYSRALKSKHFEEQHFSFERKKK
jgi:putative phosphoesterase